MDSVILVVDDEPVNLMLANKILGEEKGFKIARAHSGEAALQYLDKTIPDLILLDINMPYMNGFEVIGRLKENVRYKSIPVIFLTADAHPEIEISCFEHGAVDFVKKPFIPMILKSRVKKILELQSYRAKLEDMVTEQAAVIRERTNKIGQLQDDIIIGMANLIESRDGSTGEHVKKTKIYVELIGKRLKERKEYPFLVTDDYIEYISKMAPLHDIGKIKISDTILQKKGKLTKEEYNIIKTHTILGEKVLEDVIGSLEDEQYIKTARDIVLYHHERFDGYGYPQNLKGEEIPLSARIMAVADVFDAMCSKRCYKPAIPIDQVIKIMKSESGKQFDPVIIHTFLELEPELRKIVTKKNVNEF